MTFSLTMGNSYLMYISNTLYYPNTFQFYHIHINYLYHLCVFQNLHRYNILFERPFLLAFKFRVLLKNTMMLTICFYRRNEEVDEKALIKKLRKRVAELESELSCLLMAKVFWSKCNKKKKIHALDRFFLWINRKIERKERCL